MRSYLTAEALWLGAVLTIGCSPEQSLPTAPAEPGPAFAGAPWGPEDPRFNLEVILRSPTGSRGFGHVTFRQPNDDLLVIQLGTLGVDLPPNSSFVLQRAVDTQLDRVCTSTTWLTLGKGLIHRRSTPMGQGARGRISSGTSRRSPSGRHSTSTSG